MDDRVLRAARTYSAAADHDSRSALGFWDTFGPATNSQLSLPAGGSVLDLCCGAGASAIPAARAVGPAGRVLAVDLAEPLLDLARARSRRAAIAPGHRPVADVVFGSAVRPV